MTTRIITLVATNAAGSVQANVSASVADAPAPGELVFQEGVPSSIDVSALMPLGADRYHGGYYSRQVGVYSDDDHLPGMTLNVVKRTIDYDGSPLTASGAFKNPNSSYFIGRETGPYNTHWQYPPRTLNIPQQSGNPSKIQAINGGSKHTRARFCPRDNLIHIFGGDYSSAGVINDGHQDGRMLFWNFDPVANKWAYNYPPLGRAGEEQPLSPDIMGFGWDIDREIWWMSWGDARAGVVSEVHWKSPAIGGLSDVWPKYCGAGAITDAPIFTFDPKLPQPKYKRCGFQPWNIIQPKMREHAYDNTTKRLYKLEPVGTGVRVHWLDTTLYETDPINMPWSQVDVDLAAGKPNNLTGSGAHQFATGYFESPCHIDEQARRLYFVDSRTPGVLALTLPGNPLGAHKVQLVADIPGPNLAQSPMGLLACASMPFVWIEQHRKLVMMCEPLWEMVGPLSVSLTIDVDSGVVSEGPRFPSLANGKPWFPGAAVWYPPTQELIAYAYYPNTSLPYLTPQTMHAYKWTP